jgi:hypothetical protein
VHQACGQKTKNYAGTLDTGTDVGQKAEQMSVLQYAATSIDEQARTPSHTMPRIKGSMKP